MKDNCIELEKPQVADGEDDPNQKKETAINPVYNIFSEIDAIILENRARHAAVSEPEGFLAMFFPKRAALLSGLLLALLAAPAFDVRLHTLASLAQGTL